jgi:cytochrome c oxidase subunit IV
MKNGNENNSRKSFHRRSFFGPILLITIGLVFLGKNVGLIPGEGWGTIWRLWPLLLIIGGLDELFRREGVAWPVLMIGAGIVLLINYFGPRSWISWTQILQLWPILIIAVGIDVMFRGQSGWKSLLGVILSIILIGAAVLLAFQGVEIQANYLQIDERYSSSVESAELDLSLSVGEFVLGSDDRNGKLIIGSITPGSVVDDLDEKSGRVFYELVSTKPAFFPHTARWELDLTPELPLDLKVDNSVGEMLLDFVELDLDSLLVKQGVGRMVIGLPEMVSEDVLLKQGVGVIAVEIPEDVRIAVDAQNGLTSVRFPGDFELEDGYYTTPGTTRTNADLLIVVEQGVGLVTFQYAR